VVVNRELLSPMPSYSICVVTQQYRSVISGIGLHARNLVARLIADGHAVMVLAPEDQRPSNGETLSFVGVPPPLFAGSQARWLSLAWSFSRALRGLEHVQVFDLIHFTDARESLFYDLRSPAVGNVNDTYAADMAPLGYYRRYYEDWLWRWAYYRFVKLAEAVALPRLPGLIANSQHTCKTIASQYGLKADRLSVCYKAIEPARFAPVLKARASAAPHPARVLFVGGNMQRKGLPTLIQAAAGVLAKLPDTEFWIIGQDRAIPHMEALCHSAGVDASFHFLGGKSQAELLDFYAQADVFVMPSLVEAFGVVFLEAMASGIPVIGARAGGVPELIDHGRNGLLIEPGDAGGLTEWLLRLLTDTPLQERLRKAGLETAQQFDVERMMQCTYQVYQNVLA
jgi:glycosyltransferase involved in cell wall biosynthesis